MADAQHEFIFTPCFGLAVGGGKRQAARRNGMSEAACRSGDAKLKTEADATAVFLSVRDERALQGCVTRVGRGL